MAIRRSLATVRQSIRAQIPIIKEDLKRGDVPYVLGTARGRCMALELVCQALAFDLLGKELLRLREQSYADELQRVMEKI